MVQNHYANDLDLFELDRRQTRLHLFSQVVIANQLPAYSAGNLQPQSAQRRRRQGCLQTARPTTPARLPRRGGRACGLQASLPAPSLRTLWLEVAGRICRQLICDYHLRKQVETRLTSIKFK